MSVPTVSVLMTSYNREQYISEAIESVLNQSFRDFELIIVDDFSLDNTYEIIKSYSQKDSRIRRYQNDKNIGQFPNRNISIKYASGDIIVFLDSDDSFNSDALEYIVRAFALNPTAKHSSIYYGPFDLPFIMKSQVAIRKHFFNENILSCGPSARAFKKDFYFAMGGYPEIYGPVGDMYFNIKTTSFADILFLPYDYLNYRIHAGQEKNKIYSYIHNGYNYFNDVLKIPNIPLTSIQKAFLRNKNKKRFLINTVRYFCRTLEIKDSFRLFKMAKFSFLDFLRAILNEFNLPGYLSRFT